MREAAVEFDRVRAFETMRAAADKLGAPTPPERIEFLPRSLRINEGAKADERGLWPAVALALPYVDGRFIQERLDQSVGKFGWQSKIEHIGGYVCVGIGLRNALTGEWVWKWDTGQDDAASAEQADGEDETEPSGGKSLVSRGFKRAGYQWDIARDIYALPKRWVPCLARKRGERVFFARWSPEDVLAHIKRA